MDTHLAYIVNLLFLLNTHFHVLRFSSTRTSTCCGRLLVLQRRSHSSARCACRALSPELDCSGRFLAKRLHEPCFHEHCTKLNTRQVAHHTFDQAQQSSFIVGSHQNSLELQLCYIAENFSSSSAILCSYHSADALAPPTPLRGTALLRDRRFAEDALVLHYRVVYNNVLH